MRTRLGGLPQADIAAGSEMICRHLSRAGFMLASVQTIAVYASHGPEVSLASLASLLPDKRLVYPLCHAPRRLSFHHVTRLSELSAGTLGIPEPNAGLHPEVALADIDLILCPGLCFGLDGSRLGHGGGYYDRALEHYSGVVCGVALEQQIKPSVPHDDHDILMDWLVTENGIKLPHSRPR